MLYNSNDNKYIYIETDNSKTEYRNGYEFCGFCGDSLTLISDSLDISYDRKTGKKHIPRVLLVCSTLTCVECAEIHRTDAEHDEWEQVDYDSIPF